MLLFFHLKGVNLPHRCNSILSYEQGLKHMSKVFESSAINYQGVYNQSIYDQTDCKALADFQANRDMPAETKAFIERRARCKELRLATELIDKHLIEHLFFKKKERLDEVLTENINRSKELYQAVIGDDKSWKKFITDLMKASMALCKVDATLIENRFSDIPVTDAKLAIFKLANEHRLLESGIEREQILDLEVRYVIKKRKIKSSEIKEQIEKALIVARENTTYLDLVRKFIDYTLALPDTHRELPDGIANRIKDDVFFKEFEPKLLRKLEIVAHKLERDSRNDQSRTSTRGIYYFHGNPGTGKSSAARKLAEFMGLPYFVPPIRRIEDLSSDNLEGTERTLFSHKPGTFARALLAKNKDGRSYLNAILIIDDFDRMLLASEQRAGVPTALSFLLEYLDPEKTTYYNPYFDASIDISRLSIIITANQPIPKRVHSKSDPDTILKDPFAALRSRVTEVHFPDFPSKTISTILNPVATALAAKYQVMLNEPLTNQLINKAVDRQKQRSLSLEPRDLKKELETVIIAHKRGITLHDELETPCRSICQQFTNALRRSTLAITSATIGAAVGALVTTYFTPKNTS